MKLKAITVIVLTMLLLVASFALTLPVHSSNVNGEATTVAASWKGFFDIYGDIITFLNYSEIGIEEWTLMYYNISTGTVTNTGVTAYEPFLFWHSIYDNFITSPGPYADYGLGLYNISAENMAKLPYPYQHNFQDFLTWAYAYPSNIISIYGDIIAFFDYDGVWAYNITTSSIIANLTTGPPNNRWGVSVHDNLIAFSDGFIWYYDISTDTKTNTTVPGRMPSLYGNIIAFVDCDYLTIRYYNISSGQVSTIGSGAVGAPGCNRPEIYGDMHTYINVIVFSTNETAIDGGKDVNGDGDMKDMVVRYYDMFTHTLVNTEEIGDFPAIYGNTAVFHTYEPWVDTDLNNDGDTDDWVIRFLRPLRPQTVGGFWIPVDKLELLAPYIGLTILLAVAVVAVGYVKKRKRNTEINSQTNKEPVKMLTDVEFPF